MTEPLIRDSLIVRGGPDGDTSAAFTRWPGSSEPRLSAGEVAWIGSALFGRAWRVAGIRPHGDGSETYDLEPAEVTERERAALLPLPEDGHLSAS